jgi:hypothetical protein
MHSSERPDDASRPRDPGTEPGPALPAGLASALAPFGPWTERRVAVYDLDEAAAIAGALAAAWEEALPQEIRLCLAALGAPPSLLAPALTLDDDSLVVLLVTAPAAVCRVFDERVGRLDSHSGFGR